MLFAETTSLWVVLITALVLWLPQNVQHEGMHALTRRHWGAEITAFVPWPTWSKGRFTWAHVKYRYPRGSRPSSLARGISVIAPQAMNTVLLATLALLYWHPLVRNTLTDVGLSMLLGWYVTNFVDGAWNLGTFYKPEPEKKRSDGWRFQEIWELPVWACRVGAAVWHLWFGAHLLLPPGSAL